MRQRKSNRNHYRCKFVPRLDVDPTLSVIVRFNSSITVMEEIARETSKRGATMMNIMPLIPAHNFADKRPPTCKELDDARAKANKYLAQFTVCKQCTADARGIPGRERGYQDLL